MHKLTHFRLCPFSRAIRLALAELGLEAELVEEASIRRLFVDQTEAVGHAVRASYMYSGMADVAAMTGDLSSRTAGCRRPLPV